MGSLRMWFQTEGRACTGKNGTRKKPEGKLELSEQGGGQGDIRVKTEPGRAKK